MTITTISRLYERLPLAIGLAASMSTSAFAASFQLGEISGQFDSSLSVGASWSTAHADRDLVGSANGGTGFTQTGDDGRLNFKRGETFSKIFKGIHDLELKYGDTGVFLRGKYWYDFELKDESRPHIAISDHNRKEAAKSSGYELLDAFVYHNYFINEQPGAVRLGKQVVSWGESTFIGNSINAINPIDAAAFRRPGAEIKEGLIPVNMLYFAQSLGEQLSMEAFYQLEWDQTIIDNCGTFFAPNDVLADGCTQRYQVLDGATVNGLLAGPGAGILASRGVMLSREGLLVPRGADRDARDAGQFGLALRWLGDGAEYAAYFLNYHSRTPNVSYRNADAADIVTALTGAGAPGLTSPTLLGRGSYYLEYPEDIQLYGLSFSTTLPTGTAWQGEVSYRPNMPLQLNTSDMTAKLANPALAAVAAGGGTAGLAAALALANGENRGYNRKEVTQLQTTLTHFFDQVLGADRLTVVGEAGYTYLGGLESQSELRYGRDSIYGTPYGTQPSNAQAAQMYGYHGFYTTSSWGYRARAILDYSNAIAGITLKPNLAWSHDVDGYGPVFNEGAKALSVGLDAEYQNTYTASLSYSNFFGGDFNTLVDRDFLAFSLGVNF